MGHWGKRWGARWGRIATGASVACLLLAACGSPSHPQPTGSPPESPPIPTPSPTPTWPDRQSTGVTAGTQLRSWGSITITQDGTVIDGLDVLGCIVVRANNVTIRNTRVSGTCPDGRLSIDTGEGDFHGILVESVEIDGGNLDSFGAGIGYSGYTCRRCDIHGVGQGASALRDVVIEDSWIHDLYSADGSHNEPVLSNGGSRIVVRHNNLDGNDAPGMSAALALYGDLAPISDVLVEGNLFNGGGYCVYAGSVAEKAYPVANNVRFIGNTFGRELQDSCGWAGPVTGWAGGHGNTWSDNVWVDGTPIHPSG